MRARRDFLAALGLSIGLFAGCRGETTVPTGPTDPALLPSAQVTNQSSHPVFVIGDAEAHGLGAEVTFWGAQWWKANFMSGGASSGVASFKGYAEEANDFCGGVWSSRPGNSSHPPATIPEDVMVVVTSQVTKTGASISGDIKEIVMVRHDGGYGPNPGHAGKGTVTSVVCSGEDVVVIF